MAMASNIYSLEEDATVLPPDFVFSPAHEFSSLTVESVHEGRLGKRAIVVRSLFSESECRQIVDFMEEKNRVPSYDGEVTMVLANLKKEYRNHRKLVAFGEAMASTVGDRVLSVLRQLAEDEKQCIKGVNDFEYLNDGVGMLGTWRAVSMNECFRLCKYDPLGHFGPHYDGDFIVDPTSYRSLKTFMIYLNDDYDGGETAFSESHDLYFDAERKINCSPEEAVFAKFKARRGDALIFDHKLLHEGQQVLSGCKYIMRSEVMYQKDAVPDELRTKDDERMESAVKIYYEGMALEAEGDIDGAISKYKRALKTYPDVEKYF